MTSYSSSSVINKKFGTKSLLEGKALSLVSLESLLSVGNECGSLSQWLLAGWPVC